MKLFAPLLVLFLLPLGGLTQNSTFLALFDEATLPYEAPETYYSMYEADESSVDYSEIVPFKEIDQTAYADFAEVVYDENASVFAVNKIKIGDNYLLVYYVNTFNPNSGEEINQYQAVTITKDGEFKDVIVLSEESFSMGADVEFLSYNTSSQVIYDEFDEAFYIILVHLESKNNGNEELGAIYSSSVTSFRKIEENGNITDVTVYWE